MIFAAFFCGVASTWIFGALAAKGTRRTIDRIVAHLLELRLFIDEPSVVMKAQRDLLRENWRLLAQLALPCLATALLFGTVIWQFGASWDRSPLPAGATTVVTARYSGRGDVQLQATPEIAVETPAVRILATREVSWRIRPLRAFAGELSARTTEGRDVALQIPFPRATMLGITGWSGSWLFPAWPPWPPSRCAS